MFLAGGKRRKEPVARERGAQVSFFQEIELGRTEKKKNKAPHMCSGLGPSRGRLLAETDSKKITSPDAVSIFQTLDPAPHIPNPNRVQGPEFLPVINKNPKVIKN